MASIDRLTRRSLAGALLALLLLTLAGGQAGALAPAGSGNSVSAPAVRPPQARGPEFAPGVLPYVWNGDLRDLPADDPHGSNPPQPARPIPGKRPGGDPFARDPIAQLREGPGQMPDPILTFPAMAFNPNGAGWPPDPNAAAGPNHIIEVVNTSVGIYSKTGTELWADTFDTFFNAPGQPCDSGNGGDPVVLYDSLADRWIVTDFWINGPYYECVAVSQTGDPVSGGWYFYSVPTGTVRFFDYPKLGVWPDGYYMMAHMFGQSDFVVQFWALDRVSMLGGGPANTVSFEIGPDQAWYGFLPSHVEGSPPPSGAPNYFLGVAPPDQLGLWEFAVDWGNPGNSTFTGPVTFTVPALATLCPGTSSCIPQLGTTAKLDALDNRFIMQLQYRNFGTHEALWATQTTATLGRAGKRWYEIRDPGGAPAIYQMGTYAPADGIHRWMGSLAVDRDGNMALGYSVSNAGMYPGIRYAGRLAGEILGQLPQAEAILFSGTGSQTCCASRWGDYSSMVIDPVDQCTFWYTNEYYAVTGSDWQTRIGAFRFPQCGQPKGYLQGTIRNSVTLQPIAGAPVNATLDVTRTMTVATDASGTYLMPLLPGSYTVTAGPLLPGYPVSRTVSGVNITVGVTTTQDLTLDPVPFLVEERVTVADPAPGGNGNGYVEPGEAADLWNALRNTGAITATNVSAVLSSSTSGVSILTANAGYPDIAAGAVATNTTAFRFELDPALACGSILDFSKTVTTAQGVFTGTFSLIAGVPEPRAELFSDTVENGLNGWTTGGTRNTWAITEETAHSPTHSWSDSPNGSYQDSTNSWLRSPLLDLSGRTEIQISFWTTYTLESGYDYVFVEYSTDGGTTWGATPLATLNGAQLTWRQVTVDAAPLDDVATASFRFRLQSDGGVVFDGIHIDDIAVSYQPYSCAALPSTPRLLLPVVLFNATGP